MTVYLVILEDRHVDVSVTVFASPDAALSHARAVADEYLAGADPDDDERCINPTPPKGWLFDASLGEGDAIRVEPAEVQE